MARPLLCRPSLCAFLAVASGLAAQTRWTLATPLLPFYGGAVAAHDAAGQRVIVVALTSNQTWVVSSQTGVWSQLPNYGPGWITDPSMTFDAQRARAVWFGGANAQGTALAGTWELVGTAWQQRTFAVTPPARHNAGLCFDAAAGVVRMAGGEAGPLVGGSTPLGDVWTYDGVQWTAAPLSASGPLGTTAMAFDSARGRCVALAANGTFEWVGSSFVAVPTANLPPPRRSTVLVYDALRERMVLYGGRNYPASSLGDLWEYDGVDWIQRSPLGVVVPELNAHGMMFDPEVGAVRVFAGDNVLVTGVSTTGIGQVRELRYEAVSPAVVQLFGNGCGLPVLLAAQGLPWLGDTTTLSMPVGAPAGPVLMALGFSNQQAGGVPLPLPIDFLGFPNCELLVSPDVLLAATLAGTTASLPLAIPNQPPLLGVRFYAQGFELSFVGAGRASVGLFLQVGGR